MRRDFVILVVDDSRTNRMLLVRYLHEAGYTTVEAESAAAAMARMVEQLPDLILLDVVMPAMSGFELCAQLKADEATRDIPVIFLTSLDSPETKVKGLELGAVDFITKPFDPPEVIARVRTQVALHRMVCTILETNDRLARDLETARLIQTNFLPARDVVIGEGVTFDYAYQPCDELGGDFFNIFPIDPTRVLFYISDVSGHGVASALLTIFTHTYLGTHARRHPDPADLLCRFNRQFFRESLSEKYIGVFLAILDVAAGTLTWSAAGLTVAPILYRAGDATLLTMDSFPVGLVSDATYTNQVVSAPAGSSILMYSDGLTDRRDAADAPVLDEDALLELVRQHAADSPAGMIDSILQRVTAVADDETATRDDLTLFLVTRR